MSDIHDCPVFVKDTWTEEHFILVTDLCLPHLGDVDGRFMAGNIRPDGEKWLHVDEVCVLGKEEGDTYHTYVRAAYGPLTKEEMPGVDDLEALQSCLLHLRLEEGKGNPQYREKAVELCTSWRDTPGRFEYV